MKKIMLALFLVSIFNISLYSQSLHDAFRFGSSGMMAQKLKLAVIAENMANLTTLQDEETGLPWQKRYVVLKPDAGGVRAVSIDKSDKPFGKYYDPAVPQSNADGFTAYPNVNLPDEMVNLAYTEVALEANVNTFKTTKTMYNHFIDILK